MIKKIKNYFLVKKYPWLQCRNVWNGKKLGYDFIWLDDMPIGWRKAFGMDMVKELDVLLKMANFDKEYQIVQVKEKYGELRWYDNGVPDSIYEEFSKVISKYEDLSRETCLVCGNCGKIDYNDSWLMPLCEKHRKDMKNGKL